MSSSRMNVHHPPFCVCYVYGFTVQPVFETHATRIKCGRLDTASSIVPQTKNMSSPRSLIHHFCWGLWLIVSACRMINARLFSPTVSLCPRSFKRFFLLTLPRFAVYYHLFVLHQTKQIHLTHYERGAHSLVLRTIHTQKKEKKKKFHAFLLSPHHNICEFLCRLTYC